jgi:hypothetical protein
MEKVDFIAVLTNLSKLSPNFYEAKSTSRFILEIPNNSAM